MRTLTSAQKKAKNEYMRQWRAQNLDRTRAAAKRWRENNLEQVREYKRRYYAENSQEVNERVRQWRENNPELVAQHRKAAVAANKQRSKTDPGPALRSMVNSARTRAKRDGREFTIDLDYVNQLWVKQKGLCKLSKLPMSTELGSRELRVSLDRINNAKGYVKGNVQLLQSMVNNAKNKYTQADFVKMCRAVAKQNPK